MLIKQEKEVDELLHVEIWDLVPDLAKTSPAWIRKQKPVGSLVILYIFIWYINKNIIAPVSYSKSRLRKNLLNKSNARLSHGQGAQ